MGDASNAGLFQNSKRQALKIMSKYCWARVHSNERAHVEWEYWLDVHLVEDGTGRGCLALVRKQLVTAGLCANWTSLGGLESLRAVVYVSDVGCDQKKLQAILAGTREAFGLVPVLRIGLFQAQASTCCGAQLEYGDELCRWLGSLHGYCCTLAKLMNFARGTSMVKEESARVVRQIVVTMRTL